ncbi:hypothetical protein ACOME3_002843 [Neoechinorhynchus agilis]
MYVQMTICVIIFYTGSLDCSINDIVSKYRRAVVSKQSYPLSTYNPFVIKFVGTEDALVISCHSIRPLIPNQSDGWIIEGKVHGHPNSKVKGSLIGKHRFDGDVTFGNQTTFSIEPLSRFGYPESTELAVYSLKDVRRINGTFDFISQEKYGLVRPVSRRVSRAVKSSFDWPKGKSCCHIYIRSDIALWNDIYRNEGQRDVRLTEMAILDLFHMNER